MSTEQRIINMVSWMANVPLSMLHIHTHLKDDLHLDSLDVLMLIVQLERRFKVSLSAEEVEGIETIHDVARCFRKYLAVATANS